MLSHLAFSVSRLPCSIPITPSLPSSSSLPPQSTSTGMSPLRRSLPSHSPNSGFLMQTNPAGLPQLQRRWTSGNSHRGTPGSKSRGQSAGQSAAENVRERSSKSEPAGSGSGDEPIVLALPGKTNNLLAWYYTHALKIWAGGVVVSSLALFGVWEIVTFTVRSVVLLAVFAASGYIYFKRRRDRQLLAFPLLSQLIHKHRAKIEREIGPLDDLEEGDVISQGKVDPHCPHPMIIFQFHLGGAHGRLSGAMRALEMKTVTPEGKKEEKIVVEKLRVDTMSFDGKQNSMFLVNKDLSTPVYHDVTDVEDLTVYDEEK